MEAVGFEPLAPVEAMSIGAVIARVQVQLAGALGAPEVGEPGEKSGAVPVGASLGKRDQLTLNAIA